MYIVKYDDDFSDGYNITEETYEFDNATDAEAMIIKELNAAIKWYKEKKWEYMILLYTDFFGRKITEIRSDRHESFSKWSLATKQKEGLS